MAFVRLNAALTAVTGSVRASSMCCSMSEICSVHTHTHITGEMCVVPSDGLRLVVLGSQAQHDGCLSLMPDSG